MPREMPSGAGSVRYGPFSKGWRMPPRRCARPTGISTRPATLARHSVRMVAEPPDPADAAPYEGRTIADVARALKARDVSAESLTERCLARIAERDSSINAFISVLDEQARGQSREADREIAAGRYRGPLHGVPIAVKDLCYTKGSPTAAGMAIHKNFSPDHDSTVVERFAQAGAVLLGKLQLTEGAFADHHPAKEGYPIEDAEAGGATASAVPLPNLLAAADVAKGEAVFAKCAACHTINSGGANGIGPNLYGTMGEPIGQGKAGFGFSDALKNVGGTWDFEKMDHWLTSPRKFANGTKMSFAGLGSAEDRANLIVYLNAQGSNLPLPAAEAAPAADAAAAPAAADKGAAAPAEGAAAARAPAEAKK